MSDGRSAPLWFPCFLHSGGIVQAVIESLSRWLLDDDVWICSHKPFDMLKLVTSAH